jgi:hypothetical protein
MVLFFHPPNPVGGLLPGALPVLRVDVSHQRRVHVQMAPVRHRDSAETPLPSPGNP